MNIWIALYQHMHLLIEVFVQGITYVISNTGQIQFHENVIFQYLRSVDS